VRNELDMAAESACVWTWLIRASLWPEWCINAANVRILKVTTQNSSSAHVPLEDIWHHHTSTVIECVPHERMVWNACAFGLDVYHAWVLQPSNKGCYVLTEETQHGWRDSVLW